MKVELQGVGFFAKGHHVKRPKHGQHLQQQDQRSNHVSSATEFENPYPNKTVLSIENAESVIIDFNNQVNQGWKSVKFKIDEQAEEVIVQLVDTESQEVLKEFPNEEFIQLILRLDPLKGVFLDNVK